MYFLDLTHSPSNSGQKYTSSSLSYCTGVEERKSAFVLNCLISLFLIGSISGFLFGLLLVQRSMVFAFFLIIMCFNSFIFILGVSIPKKLSNLDSNELLSRVISLAKIGVLGMVLTLLAVLFSVSFFLDTRCRYEHVLFTDINIFTLLPFVFYLRLLLNINSGRILYKKLDPATGISFMSANGVHFDRILVLLRKILRNMFLTILLKLYELYWIELKIDQFDGVMYYFAQYLYLILFLAAFLVVFYFFFQLSYNSPTFYSSYSLGNLKCFVHFTLMFRLTLVLIHALLYYYLYIDLFAHVDPDYLAELERKYPFRPLNKKDWAKFHDCANYECAKSVIDKRLGYDFRLKYASMTEYITKCNEFDRSH